MKSKSTAYILWLCLGLVGAHKFYLNKPVTGILYFFTFGVFGFAWFIDLFTLGTGVDTYNAFLVARNYNNVNQTPVNIVVNNGSHGQQNFIPALSDQLFKLSELKEKGILTDNEFAIQKARLLQ